MSSNRQPEENENLLNFIAATVEMIRDRMATKDDTARLDSRIDKLEATMATKDDMARLDSKLGALEVKVDRLEVTTTVIKGEVEQVHMRLDGIDRALSSRLGNVEAEMSRMRSVLYLLVKDKPDMLRLLGQAPPAGG